MQKALFRYHLVEYFPSNIFLAMPLMVVFWWWSFSIPVIGGIVEEWRHNWNVIKDWWTAQR